MNSHLERAFHSHLVSDFYFWIQIAQELQSRQAQDHAGKIHNFQIHIHQIHFSLSI